MRIEFTLEKYEKYADNAWHLRGTENIGETGVNLSVRGGKFYYDGEETNLNTDPNNPTCGAYFKVTDIHREKDYAITDKILCEFTTHYRRPIVYVVGVLVYRNSMPSYFCHPKEEPSSFWGYNVSDVIFSKDIMQLRKWIIKKFKGNMYFDETNRKAFAELI